MSVGQRIRTRRNELKMSVDELAKRLHKNRATIYRYEKGEIENLPLDILEPLADALETTPQYLMGWDEIKDDTSSISRTSRHIKDWYSEFRYGTFTDEEYQKLFDYARFLISQREKQ